MIGRGKGGGRGVHPAPARLIKGWISTHTRWLGEVVEVDIARGNFHDGANRCSKALACPSCPTRAIYRPNNLVLHATIGHKLTHPTNWFSGEWVLGRCHMAMRARPVDQVTRKKDKEIPLLVAFR
jgi:hypothetical protein